uniref:Uncharacterized protein n=1 Tax=Arundo donax TaxID=35708 RepID=A0A0A9DI03_ARUDO
MHKGWGSWFRSLNDYQKSCTVLLEIADQVFDLTNYYMLSGCQSSLKCLLSYQELAHQNYFDSVSTAAA